MLRGNHVHHLGNDNPTLGSFDLNAHGIAVYGDSVEHPITGLVIEGNEVDHLKLGASESVVVNGNVDGWRVSRQRHPRQQQHRHRRDRLRGDAARAVPLHRPQPRPQRRDRRQHRPQHHLEGQPDLLRGRRRGATAPTASTSTAAPRSAIERNTVSGNDIGIEVAAENARGSADHVLVSRNVITRSAYVGIATGGYCNGGEACGGEQTGIAHDNRFVHNTLYANNQLDDGSPEVLVQYYAYRTTFAHNRRLGDERRPGGARHGRRRRGRRAEHAAEGRPQHVLDHRRAPEAGDVRVAGDDVHRVRHLPEGDRAGPAQPVRQVPPCRASLSPDPDARCTPRPPALRLRPP